MSQKPITLLFLCDTAEAEQRWRNFLTYFPAHGYACSLYALKTGQMVTVSAPDEPLSPPRRQAQGTLAGLLSAHNGQSALVPIADATSASALLARHHAHSSPTVFLAPNSRHLARLLLSSPPPSPSWIALTTGQRYWAFLLRLRKSKTITCHLFQGLQHDLVQTKGWERVAYALRLWLEQTT